MLGGRQKNQSENFYDNKHYCNNSRMAAAAMPTTSSTEAAMTQMSKSQEVENVSRKNFTHCWLAKRRQVQLGLDGLKLLAEQEELMWYALAAA